MSEEKVCRYCLKTFSVDDSFDFANHVRWCSDNPGNSDKDLIRKKMSNAILGSYAKLKGDKPKVFCLTCGKEFISERSVKRKYCSRACISISLVPIECIFCGKMFRNSGGCSSHSPYCKSNPNRVKRSKSPLAHRKKGSIPWSKGLTAETDIRIANGLKKLQDKVDSGEYVYPKGWKHSDVSRKKMSDNAVLKGFGGYKKGSGIGKSGWYGGIFCDSSWELAYVIFNQEHGIPISRCKERRTYYWNGKLSIYLPDFVVNDKVVEIKGYKTDRWLEKLRCNPDVTVLYHDEMIPYLDYAVEKYGKDFIKLYTKYQV